jgi:hypothetical protein
MAAGMAAKRVSPEPRAELFQKVPSVRTEQRFFAAPRAHETWALRITRFFHSVVHGFLAEQECLALHDDESIKYLIDIISVEIRSEEAGFTEVGFGPIWNMTYSAPCNFKPCIISDPWKRVCYRSPTTFGTQSDSALVGQPATNELDDWRLHRVQAFSR